MKPISFDPFGNAYFGVGAKVGNAFKDGMTLKNFTEGQIKERTDSLGKCYL